MIEADRVRRAHVILLGESHELRYLDRAPAATRITAKRA
jgi:hypothetical protein